MRLGRHPQRVSDAAIKALADVDGGFEVSSSCGFVMAPRDAATPAAVLQLADERLYAEKARRRYLEEECECLPQQATR